MVAAFLLRSRETQVAANRRLREEIDELKAERDRQARQLQKQQQTIDDLNLRTAELERERDAAKQSVNLPEDPPIATHGSGARMISLAVNVARSVGLRGAPSECCGWFSIGWTSNKRRRRGLRFAIGSSGWAFTTAAHLST